MKLNDVISLSTRALVAVQSGLNQAAEEQKLPPVFDEQGELSWAYRITPAPRVSLSGITVWVQHLPTKQEIKYRLPLVTLVRLLF